MIGFLNTNPLAPLSVNYTTASTEAVAGFVADRDTPCGRLSCTLLSRGFNNSYVIGTSSGERFVLRMSGHRARSPADVAGEAAFLAYLDASGVPVAMAMPARDGALFTTAVLPSGPRSIVLLRYVEGWRPDQDAAEYALKA